MNKKYKGVVCIMLAAFCFAMMTLFVRLSGELPPFQKSFFRNSVAMVFALIVLIKNRPKIHLEKKDWWYLFLRSFLGTLGILCNFYAIDHLVLSDANMLNKMSPFFAILFSYFVLKEKITLFQFTAVTAAFVGAVFIIKPTGLGVQVFPALMGLIGGICAGFAYTMVRALGKRGVQGPFIVFVFSAFSCAFTLPYLIFNYHPMETSQLLSLLGAGLAAAGGQFSITAAYCYAPASEISVYDYTQILFSAFLGYVVFQQVPDCWSWLGYVIICSAGVAVFFTFEKKAKETIKQGSV